MLVPVFYVEWLAAGTHLYDLQAGLFLMTLVGGVLFVGGWKWLKGLWAPLAFLSFGLPVFDGFVDAHTGTVQLLSTDVSYWLMRVTGMNPERIGPSIIRLSRYTMDVGIPCSGMKILLSVSAFSVFFVLVAHLKLWRNALLLALVVPLALVVNSMRITLIGVVGSMWGASAAHQFHDYSGYISLGVCLVLQYALTRMLGWK